MRHIYHRLWLALYPLLNLLELKLYQWTKPSNQSLVIGTLAELRRRSEFCQFVVLTMGYTLLIVSTSLRLDTCIHNLRAYRSDTLCSSVWG